MTSYILDDIKISNLFSKREATTAQWKTYNHRSRCYSVEWIWLFPLMAAHTILLVAAAIFLLWNRLSAFKVRAFK